MWKIRKAKERGLGEHGWLHSRHTFSFADYYDPDWMGFRDLRVINEDWIRAGHGFPPHGHKDMEIITYVVEGALEHQDSGGNRSVIRPGEVQHMSAGTGVRHSEYNHQKDQDVHLLQVWILPNRGGLPFGYGQKSFAEELAAKDLVLTASGDGRDGSLSLHQDVDLYASRLKQGKRVDFALRGNRHAWLQVVKGEVLANGQALQPGDALYGEGGPLEITAQQDAEFLLFDLA
jgi:redox-sensitive bicupin YhaK (pirin superfamily)